MTLKEFSAEYLPLPDADDLFYNEFRQVFPIELRYEERDVIKPGWFFNSTKRVRILQARWERVHKGEVIERKWKDVPVATLPNYE